MPVEIITELILRPILELILHVIGYYTSRIILPIVSLGKIIVEPGEKGTKVYPKWHGFNKASTGKVILHCEMGALIGICFWLVVITIAVIYV